MQLIAQLLRRQREGFQRTLAMSVAIMTLSMMYGPWSALAQAVSPRAALTPVSLSPAPGFKSPIMEPAVSVPAVARAPMLAVTTAGSRLVGVGLRGVIAWSDDAGQTWVQAQVPVQVDLTAVSFPTPEHGWAVGHRGVVLESSDGGRSWVRRYAEGQLNEAAVGYYGASQPAQGSAAALALARAERAVKDGLTPSVLDVWFESPTSGTFVGSFNLVFRTEDSGKTWQPWMDRTDNPEERHIFAVRGNQSALYMAGEKGNVWRLETPSRRWLRVPTGYSGTLFGLVVDGSTALAYGMRGSIFVTEDAGHAWRQVATQRQTGLAAGLLLRNGEIVLSDQTGVVLRSRDHGRTFAAVDPSARALAFSLTQANDGRLLSAGPAGFSFVPLPPP